MTRFRCPHLIYSFAFITSWLSLTNKFSFLCVLFGFFLAVVHLIHAVEFLYSEMEVLQILHPLMYRSFQKGVYSISPEKIVLSFSLSVTLSAFNAYILNLFRYSPSNSPGPCFILANILEYTVGSLYM